VGWVDHLENIGKLGKYHKLWAELEKMETFTRNIKKKHFFWWKEIQMTKPEVEHPSPTKEQG